MLEMVCSFSFQKKSCLILLCIYSFAFPLSCLHFIVECYVSYSFLTFALLLNSGPRLIKSLIDPNYCMYILEIGDCKLVNDWRTFY